MAWAPRGLELCSETCEVVGESVTMTRRGGFIGVRCAADYGLLPVIARDLELQYWGGRSVFGLQRAVNVTSC